MLHQPAWYPWDSYEEKKRYHFDSGIHLERQRWIASKGIAHPDRVVHQFAFCNGTRKENSWPFPFPGQLSDKWKGVYLLFVETGPDHCPYTLFPIYAGQSKKVGHRLRIHHSDPVKGQFFIDLLNSDDEHTLDPTLWSACWWIKEKHKRISAEHALIAQLAPMLNKS